LSRYLVLRVPTEESAHSQKKFSTLALELVLRDVPGKSVERSGCTEDNDLGDFLRHGSLLDVPRPVVVRMPASPARLRLCLTRRLALIP